MYSLLIDTHDKEVLYVLYKDTEVLSIKNIDSKMGHSEIAMPTLVSLISESNLKLEDISNIIAVVGPGSFTGVRIGVVIAKTIAYLLDKPIRCITSIDLKAFSNENIIKGLYKIDEKNGYFIVKYNDDGSLDGDIKYYSKKEYDQKFNDEDFVNVDNLDFINILKHSLNKEPTNPHLVNPIYVKQIEALKWLV